MKLTFLPRSARLPKRGYRLVLAAALFVAVAIVGVFSHASVAHASSSLYPSDLQHIVNRNSGDLLDAQGASRNPGAFVIQWPLDGGLNQEWKLVPVPGSSAFFIQNVNSGLLLDVYQAWTTPGAPVIQWPLDGGLNQEWVLVPVPGSSAFFIQNVNSGLLLDVYGASTAPDASVIQWPLDRGLNQMWYFKKITN